MTGRNYTLRGEEIVEVRDGAEQSVRATEERGTDPARSADSHTGAGTEWKSVGRPSSTGHWTTDEPGPGWWWYRDRHVRPIPAFVQVWGDGEVWIYQGKESGTWSALSGLRGAEVWSVPIQEPGT